jgi:CheY-like chemotaxis protein
VTQVLVVDDEPDIIQVVSRILARAGHEVLAAADGAEAIAHLADHHVDLMILDLQMPVLDGLSVLELLREQDDAPAVIVLSANADYGDGARARQLGALAIVAKPFEAAALRELVASVIER